MSAVEAAAGRLAPWWPSLRAPLLVFLPVRVGLLLLGLLGVGLLQANRPVEVPGWPAPSRSSPWHAVVTSWERQDVLWFLRIADTGYAPDDGSAAFFPLFPLLVRGVGAVLDGSLLPAAYLLWWHVAHGDAGRPLEVQRSSWQREPSWPWQTLFDGGREGLVHLGTYAGGYHSVDLLLVATWSVWLWASLVLPLTMQFPGRPLLSMPRYLVVLPPLFWALARFSERYRVHDAVVGVSAVGLGVFGVLFVNWYYVF